MKRINLIVYPSYEIVDILDDLYRDFEMLESEIQKSNDYNEIAKLKQELIRTCKIIYDLENELDRREKFASIIRKLTGKGGDIYANK